MNIMAQNGLLILNLGTPGSPTPGAVKRYLREFLMDKRVITLPWLARFLLVYGIIAPFRGKQSAHAYQSIWTDAGSPLMVHSQALVTKLQQALGTRYQVVLGMRYGNPSIKKAIQQLTHCKHITILPLYPQYSSAATGSSITCALTYLTKKSIIPSLNLINNFYQHPAFINVYADLIRPYLLEHDFILFSYHGLPENHLAHEGCQPVCQTICRPGQAEKGCYRAQSLQTTKLIANALNLLPQHYQTSFQSRLGKTPWIKPYTDEVLPLLIKQGVRRIAIACPSFVADCLETLEEIGIRANEQWQALGGECLTLIPSLNTNDAWINAILNMVTLPTD